MDSDQNILALSDGTVTRARAMTRIVPSMRWDADRLLRLKTTPFTESTTGLDTIEAEENPHDHSSAEHPSDEPDAARAKRPLTIERSDLGACGFSRACPNADSTHRTAMQTRSVHIIQKHADRGYMRA